MIFAHTLTETIAAGATVRLKLGNPRGSILRRLCITGNGVATCDWALVDADAASPATTQIYASDTADVSVDTTTFACAYMPAPNLYLNLKNNAAGAVAFAVKLVVEEPTVSY
jgi:hypothetical protein